MPNGTYGGVRGRKTKVGRKLLRFPPTRFSRQKACFQWREMKGRRGRQPDSGLLESASLAKGQRKGSAAS